MRIDARLCDTKRTTRSSIVSPSMRRIDDNTQTLFLCVSVYLFFKVKLFINRIKRSLLQKEKKEGQKDLSLSLSKHTAFALCALLCLSPSTVQAPSLRNGEARNDEKERKKERKKEKREKKRTHLKP